MSAEWIIERFLSRGMAEAFFHKGRSYSYAWLCERLGYWSEHLSRAGVRAGTVTAVCADYSPDACALLVALVLQRAIIVPISSATRENRPTLYEIAQAEIVVDFETGDAAYHSPGRRVDHPLLLRLREEGAPGLVLFSSGSTGQPKGVVHNLSRLLEKFRTPRPAMRTLVFLLFDHIGGVNTLFHTLINGGTVVTPDGRTPSAVCRDIAAARVQLLPTSPTFLNLLILSEEYHSYDLSSLQLITYGTEVMPDHTLKRLNEIFPDVRLQQTYGLSELGILRTKSRHSGSLWVKLGGEGFETRVVDGVLWIRAESAMLGYLNAPQPFDEEGWFNTQDRVEVDGEFMRILGRSSEIINVGGEKVFPAEVESILLDMEGVLDATVQGERNALVGQIVVARVRLADPEQFPTFKARMRAFCQGRLEAYKIPVKVELDSTGSTNPRFKKMRRE